MVRISGTTITMTRGDTLCVDIEMTLGDEPYTPASGDVIRFALKTPLMTVGRREFVDREPLILKTIPTDSCQLVLQPEDTKPFDFGKYVYDIEITMEDGTVDTFISESDFIIAPEVH